MEPLYDQDEPSEIPPASKKAKRDNYYGPEDNEDQDNVEDANKSSSAKWWDIGPFKIKDVEIENLSKKKDFLVRFFLRAKSPLSSDEKRNKFMVNAEDKFRIINLLNLGIKGAMMDAGLRTFDEEAKNFFPTNMGLQSHLMKNVRQQSPYIAPITGLNETAQISVDDNLFVMVNFCMKWANLNVPVVSVSENHSNILGIRINLNRLPLSDKELEEIYQELRKIKFHVKYDKGQKWVTAMEAKGKTQDFIHRCREYTKRGTCRIFKSPNKVRNEVLLPTAEDHTFTSEDRDGSGNKTEFNVKTYYEAKGVHLKYPNLPVVRVSKTEWFPIEFLWQGMSAVVVLVDVYSIFSNYSIHVVVQPSAISAWLTLKIISNLL